MESKGQAGQLFATGKEDISAYIRSDENSEYIKLNRVRYILNRPK